MLPKGTQKESQRAPKRIPTDDPKLLEIVKDIPRQAGNALFPCRFLGNPAQQMSPKGTREDSKNGTERVPKREPKGGPLRNPLRDGLWTCIYNMKRAWVLQANYSKWPKIPLSPEILQNHCKTCIFASAKNNGALGILRLRENPYKNLRKSVGSRHWNPGRELIPACASRRSPLAPHRETLEFLGFLEAHLCQTTVEPVGTLVAAA